MTYEIYKLADFLKKKGFQKEYILLKKAVPLIDVVSLPSFEGDEVRRDSFEGRQTSYYDPKDWYGALSSLGNNVILIPFSAKSIDEDIFYRLKYIWAVNAKNFEDLKNKVGIMQYEADHLKQGELDNLKEVFPDLWNEISSKLNELDIQEDDAIYLLYNEDESPSRGFFVPEKSPRYLGHDIGHIEFDYSEEYEFKYKINTFLTEASKFYIRKDILDEIEERNDEESEQMNLKFPSKINKEDFSLFATLTEHDEYPLDEEIEKLIQYFFEVYSTDTDHMGDVFSSALSGKLEDHYMRPDSIDYDGYDYDFDNSRQSEMSNLEENMFSAVMNYVMNKKSGPLYYHKGSVLLYDI